MVDREWSGPLRIASRTPGLAYVTPADTRRRSLQKTALLSGIAIVTTPPTVRSGPQDGSSSRQLVQTRGIRLPPNRLPLF